VHITVHLPVKLCDHDGFDLSEKLVKK